MKQTYFKIHERYWPVVWRTMMLLSAFPPSIHVFSLPWSTSVCFYSSISIPTITLSLSSFSFPHFLKMIWFEKVVFTVKWTLYKPCIPYLLCIQNFLAKTLGVKCVSEFIIFQFGKTTWNKYYILCSTSSRIWGSIP